MKIAYIMSRFPHLPETFILREMSEMERQGWDIALYPLIKQEQAIIHPEAARWIPKARYLPFFFAGDLGGKRPFFFASTIALFTALGARVL